MSATGRGRRLGGPEDFYATPAWCVHRLLDVWHPTERGTWLEPSAGNGAIIRAVNTVRAGLSWVAVEVREEESATLCATGADVYLRDFLTGAPHVPDVSVVIGNPPFALAMEFIDQALTCYPNASVAFLLRLNFAASEDRSAFMRARPPSVYVLPNRPAFRDGQTDSCEYAWFVWPRGDLRERDEGRFMVLAPTPAAERERKLLARGRTFEVAQVDLFENLDVGTNGPRGERGRSKARRAEPECSAIPNARGVDGAAAIPRSENDGNPETGTETLERGAARPCKSPEAVTSPGEQRALLGGDV